MISRRDLLRRTTGGFGALALYALLPQVRGAVESRVPLPSMRRPRAKSVIFLFMEGAVSQVDSYDYKPLLEKYHGEDPRSAIGKLEKTQFANIGKVMKSPFAFRQWGQSGTWASDLFPHVNQHIDDLCIVRSMTSNFPEHTGANYFLHSGHGLQGRPSIGAWVTYALGTENSDLPGFVVLNGGQIPSGGLDVFTNGFLPASYQGSLLNAKGTPLANVYPNEKTTRLQSIKRDLARTLNEKSYHRLGAHDALESTITNFELAARMQVAVPDLIDLNDESEETKKLYGFDSDYEHTRMYARECLIARRLVERGVRFIELTIPMVNGYQRWDAHGNIAKNHTANARAVDQPIAGLLQDLKQRGLLDETLVVWTGEFGRTPFAQGSGGRDHNQFGFSMWMAGGGIKPGITFGATDEWGYKATTNIMDMHDLHATILHVLGIDHENLTYRFSLKLKG
jgi:hypothetical protein